MVGELANHEIVGDLKEIKKSVGDVVCALIVYCASHDISLTKCLAKEDLE
jgi:NTP pyrophosphatase (non-canonical NTP hydrolase)